MPFLAGLSIDQIRALTKIDPWFLANIEELISLERSFASSMSSDDASTVRSCSRRNKMAFRIVNSPHCGIPPSRKFAASASVAVSAPFSSWWIRVPPSLRLSRLIITRLMSLEDEARTGEQPRVVILGGGPNRIGQGIEFDYCCCQAAFALHESGYEVVMVNSNPETVSTDYDTSDRLFFEPLTVEDVLNVCERVKPSGVIVQFGGQTPLNLARALETAGVPIIGTSSRIDRAGRGSRAFPARHRAARVSSSLPTPRQLAMKRRGGLPIGLATRSLFVPALFSAGGRWKSSMTSKV